jgi:hypothetical protein
MYMLFLMFLMSGPLSTGMLPPAAARETLSVFSKTGGTAQGRVKAAP